MISQLLPIFCNKYICDNSTVVYSVYINTCSASEQTQWAREWMKAVSCWWWPSTSIPISCFLHANQVPIVVLYLEDASCYWMFSTSIMKRWSSPDNWKLSAVSWHYRHTRKSKIAGILPGNQVETVYRKLFMAWQPVNERYRTSATFWWLLLAVFRSRDILAVAGSGLTLDETEETLKDDSSLVPTLIKG